MLLINERVNVESRKMKNNVTDVRSDVILSNAFSDSSMSHMTLIRYTTIKKVLNQTATYSCQENPKLWPIWGKVFGNLN